MRVWLCETIALQISPLAETVGPSLKDLKLSDSNDDKSISILVALKKLKPNAEVELKEAFEKEVKFMSCLK